MKTIHYVLLAILVLILIGVSVGLFMYFKPHKNIGETKPDISITAKELVVSFSGNETESIKKFVTADPTIQVTGTVDEVNKANDTTGTIILRDASQFDGCVTCTIDKSQLPKLEMFKKGTPIVIKGQCSGIQELIEKEVIMFRCVIVEK